MRKEDTKTKNLTYLSEKKVVDVETGEIKHELETAIFKAEREPNYIKIYLEHIALLCDVPGWTSKILNELIKNATYANEGQLVIVNASYKRIIAQELGLKSAQIVTNAINELKKKKILLKKDNGVFMLNPQLFGKGEWQHVKKLRYEVEISELGTRMVLKDKEIETPEIEDIKNKFDEKINDITPEQLAQIQQILSQKTQEELVQ